jgi:hypothetical protein
MHFPKYWISAREKCLSAWGWSDTSPAEARAHAETRLAKIRAWIAQGGKSTWQQRYRALCATQKCFRARLTPKPWRCGVDKPRVRWPWGDAKWEARFRKWEAVYAKAADRYATCRLIGHFGRVDIAPELCELVEIHDRATRAESNQPLA